MNARDRRHFEATLNRLVYATDRVDKAERHLKLAVRRLSRAKQALNAAKAEYVAGGYNR